jgi:hypothetical protein
MAVSLEAAGLDRVLVNANGRISERHFASGSSRETVTDAAFVIQAAVEADILLEMLTDKSFRLGQEILEGLHVRNAQAVYDQRRKVGHQFSPFHLREVLTKAAHIIGDK